MSENGRLPDAALAPIPGGRLRKDAAEAWNAMCTKARQQGLPEPRPAGPDSSYRPYDRQVYYREYWCGQGKCGNAAVPGTSNHGLGLAVDVDDQHQRDTIAQIGRPYGWAKEWSDAPNEVWHYSWRQGVYQHEFRLAEGDRNHDVWLLTHRLGVVGYLNHSGNFYSAHVAEVVRKFQTDHHLTVDGVVGPATWQRVQQLAEAERAANPATAPTSQPTPPQPHSGTGPVRGVDLYSGDFPFDFNAYYQAGGRFLYLKISEGDYHDHTATRAVVEAARAAGLIVGGYVYLRPRSGRSGADEINRYFWRWAQEAGLYVKGSGWNLKPVLDIEESALGRFLTKRYIKSAVRALNHRIAPHRPIIYSGSFWRDALGNWGDSSDCRLWFPEYNGKDHYDQSFVPKAWTAPTIWQHTDAGRPAGSTRATDENIYYGSEAEFLRDCCLRY